MISAVVLVKNQAEQLKECLASLRWCDEIVVIDDYSSDDSVKVAEIAGTRVFQHALNNDFSAQRNYALEKVQTEWVLFVDADEVVSKSLAEEIYQQTSQFLSSINGYYLKRQDSLFGKKLKFGESAFVKLLRVAKKDKGKWEGRVHETWKVTGEVGMFKNTLIHHPHPTIREFLSEINLYSTLRATELAERNVTVGWLEVIIYPSGKFFLNLIVRGGFLDGTVGIIMALMMSFHSFLVRGKLWQLRKQRKKYDFGY